MARGVGCSRYLLEETSRHDIHFLRRLFFLSSVPSSFWKYLVTLALESKKDLYILNTFLSLHVATPYSYRDRMDGWMNVHKR